MTNSGTAAALMSRVLKETQKVESQLICVAVATNILSFTCISIRKIGPLATNEFTVQDKRDIRSLKFPSLFKDSPFKALEICINNAQMFLLSTLLVIRFIMWITHISDAKVSMHELCESCIISLSPWSNVASVWQSLTTNSLTDNMRLQHVRLSPAEVRM